MLNMLLKKILSERAYEWISPKVRNSGRVIKENPLIKLILKILFVILQVILLPIKLLLIWLLPSGLYNGLKFMIKQFFRDIFTNSCSLGLAFKRVRLSVKLFVDGRERFCSFGKENPDKTFYVLRPYYYLVRNELTTNVSNLMFHYYRNLQHLSYAVEKGWIPVVDWQNYGPFSHGEDYPVNGTTNCWEYYWNQPSEYSLEEVYRSKNVILSVQNTRDNQFVPTCSFKPPLQNQAEQLARKCPKYNRLITFNAYTEEYIDDWQTKLFPGGAKILGVGIRGTSYGVDESTLNPQGHPIQPELDRLLISIENAMREWEMDYVFIACELEQVIERVREAFAGRVIYLPRLRYTSSPKRGDVEKGLDPLYLPGQKYQSNLDYVTEMALLSRCDSLLAAMSSGVRAAIIWNAGRYERMRIMENGLW